MGKHEKHLKRIRRLMDTYQYSIQSGAFEGKVETHKSQYKEFEQAIARLEKGLNASRNDLGT
jgi:CRISPR/Cas system-associated endoribonuclease Cas2